MKYFIFVFICFFALFFMALLALGNMSVYAPIMQLTQSTQPPTPVLEEVLAEEIIEEIEEEIIEEIIEEPYFYEEEYEEYETDYYEIMRQQLLAEARQAQKASEIADFVRPIADIVSIHYENMASGFTFSHRGDVVYFAASVSKLPFALYIYHKTEQGLASMDTRITYAEIDFWEGSGFIRHRYEFGQTFNQRELLHLMLAPSDNIATRLLRRMHGLNGYRAFIASTGGNTAFVHNVTYAHLSADEAGLIMREVYHYINSDGLYSQEFLSNLRQNRYPFIISQHPVASKSGWAANFGQAYHDMALVHAPSPYTLAILSNFEGTWEDRRLFQEISLFFEDFNYRWFE